MSAAFLGPLVEKDIHRSSLVATICFSVGMAGTGFFISQKSVLGIWIMFYINITCGLALISQEKSIINAIGLAAFAGLTGNQVATYIVNHTGTFAEDTSGKMVNPTGYQNVLLFTAALYIIAMLICMFVCSITAVTKSDSLTLESELKYDMI